MPGAVIGKYMPLGYIGKVSRDGDVLIVNRVVSDAENEHPINFGSAVFLNDDNTVRVTKEGDTAANFVGIAVATVVQATEYVGQASAYTAIKPADILVRGSIIVELGTGKPKAGGQVYFNTETGKFDAAATASKTLEIPARFTTGYTDGKGGVEITILERNLI